MGRVCCSKNNDTSRGKIETKLMGGRSVSVESESSLFLRRRSTFAPNMKNFK
jgi:hypothetical protein